MAAAMMTELWISKSRRLGFFWASPRLPFRVCGLKVWVNLLGTRVDLFERYPAGHIPVLPLPYVRNIRTRLKSRLILRGRKS